MSDKKTRTFQNQNPFKHTYADGDIIFEAGSSAKLIDYSQKISVRIL